MIHLEALREFRAGVQFLRGGDCPKALTHLRKAKDLEPDNAYFISYLGLALAHAEQKWAEAEKLCHSAMRMNRRQAQLYLNLAEVYVSSGRRQDASDVLARGMHYAPHDLRIRSALGKLSTRRPPVLRFLPRHHFLNRNLGKVRHVTMQYLATL